MPKPMYVWTGTAWVSVASEVESLATYATQSYADNQPGMKLVVPTSVAVGSGSGSVATQGTVSFSGASSVSVNGCFSSTYQNYKMVLNLSGVSADTNAILRLRASGTDASGSNYNVAGLELQSTYGGPNLYRDNSVTSAFFMNLDAANNSDYYSTSFDIYNPFNAKRTTWTFQSMAVRTDSVFCSYNGGGNHTLETSYDGITFYPGSGTFSGTVRVYGYKAG